MAKRKIILIIALILTFFYPIFISANLKFFLPEKESQAEFFQSYPLSSRGYFSLENLNGSIQVMTWNQSWAEVRAVKKTKGDPKNLERVRIDVKSGHDQLIVKTIYPRLKNTGVSVDYQIRLPENLAETILKLVNGPIKINGSFNRIQASTINGAIDLQDQASQANLSTVNGGVEAKISSGQAKIETVNGAIRCYLQTQVDSLSLETVNGSIELKIASADNFNAYLEARTTNGSINIDFPLKIQSLTKEKGHLEGQIGQGGPRIRLRTVNGSIRLTR